MRNDLVNGIKIEIRIDISHEKKLFHIHAGKAARALQLESVYAKLRYSRLKETDTKEYLIFSTKASGDGCRVRVVRIRISSCTSSPPARVPQLNQCE
ncbi:hypothetical protein EVAR_80645_1 [Eumeta japonica]|uniref:Uncharacterized protein n=1 Tax=Eumeta variegata TaxID=151549 RepID=A0A4C1YWB2_EUMVA|nr:hypothetical protein EVAR_80645_1 [Eumeta japonica]